MVKQKCTKCGRELLYFTLVLMMGGRGFRRYPVCDKCKAKLKKANKITANAQAAARRKDG